MFVSVCVCARFELRVVLSVVVLLTLEVIRIEIRRLQIGVAHYFMKTN